MFEFLLMARKILMEVIAEVNKLADRVQTEIIDEMNEIYNQVGDGSEIFEGESADHLRDMIRGGGGSDGRGCIPDLDMIREDCRRIGTDLECAQNSVDRADRQSCDLIDDLVQRYNAIGGADC